MTEKKNQGPARMKPAVKLAPPPVPTAAFSEFKPEPAIVETKPPFMPEAQAAVPALDAFEPIVVAQDALIEEPAAAVQDDIVLSAEPIEVQISEPTILPVTEPQPMTAAILAPDHEGSNDMATVLEMPTFSTDKAQAMFGGLNEKAKTALAKTTKMGEEMTELSKGNVEAIVASTKLAAKGAETIGAEMVETSKKSMEATIAAIKSMAAVKSPTELFQLQSEFAKSSFDTAVADASKFSESWMKLAGEIFQPLSNRYAIAAEKMKAAAL